MALGSGGHYRIRRSKQHRFCVLEVSVRMVGISSRFVAATAPVAASGGGSNSSLAGIVLHGKQQIPAFRNEVSQQGCKAVPIRTGADKKLAVAGRLIHDRTGTSDKL